MKNTARRGLLAALIAFLIFLTALPSASAKDEVWTPVRTGSSELAGLRSGSGELWVCSGDQQLNFVYNKALKGSAQFSGRLTTPAGTAYVGGSSASGWDTSISAENSGVAAAVLDLSSREGSDIPIEAVTIALRRLTEDPHAMDKHGTAAWEAAATDLLARARFMAGPHSVVGEVKEAVDGTRLELSGVAAVGQAKKPIAGASYSIRLTGGTFEGGGVELTGVSGSGFVNAVVAPDGAGPVKAKVTFSGLPGAEFVTGHHATAQDMRTTGRLGSATRVIELRGAVRAGVPEVLTKAEIVFEGRKASVVDHVAVSLADWPAVGGEAVPLQISGTLYGPFKAPVRERADVPDGMKGTSTASVDVPASGTYDLAFDAQLKPGWYTVVVDADFAKDGAFEGLVSTPVTMPYFEEAETVVVRSLPTISTTLEAHDVDGAIRLDDLVTVSGLPDGHGSFAGLGPWKGDAKFIQELHFVPGKQTISDEDVDDSTLIHSVEFTAVNGTQRVSDSGFVVDEAKGPGTWVFVTRFAGDARVRPIVTSAADKAEQYVVEPKPEPTPVPPTPAAPEPTVEPSPAPTPKPSPEPTESVPPADSPSEETTQEATPAPAHSGSPEPSAEPSEVPSPAPSPVPERTSEPAPTPQHPVEPAAPEPEVRPSAAVTPAIDRDLAETGPTKSTGLLLLAFGLLGFGLTALAGSRKLNE